MTVTVKVDDAGTQLAELLARVEAGEEVILSRGGEPVARVTAIAALLPVTGDHNSVMDEILAARARLAPTTASEIDRWKKMGRR